MPDVPEMSESANTFNGDDVAEALVISTTHWLNERDMGDGEGPVSSEMLTEPQTASASRGCLGFGEHLTTYWTLSVAHISLVEPMCC